MSVQPSAPEPGKRPAMTMHSLMKMLADGEKITMLTAYDATFAAVADLAGVEIILVGDSLGLMDKLGIRRAHWVGESSGGIAGLAFALAHPDRLHTLTVCDTPFKRPANIAATYTVGEADRAAAFAKYGVGGWCRKTLSYRIDTTKASPELCEWYIAQMDRTPVPVAVEKEKMIGRGDFWPLLPGIKVPTLILAGQKSPLAEEEKMKAMQQHMPQAKLVTFEGYGHGINLLAPERCVSEIRQFVDTQRQR